MSDETVIIGGGPAGSAAAIQLARQGMPVRLLERQTGPHHKVCGEFISYEAAHYLGNLGVDLPALGAEPIHQVRFYHGEQEFTVNLPFTAWSLSRHTLDATLLKRAEAAGARVELGIAVRALSRAGDEWELKTSNRSGYGCACTELSAKTVFLANGKHELRGWPRILQGKVPRREQRYAKGNVRGNIKGNVRGSHNHDLIGLKMHFSPSTLPQPQWRGTVEIHLFEGGYAGLEPIEDGGINLCFLIKQDIYKSCGSSWPAVLDWLGRTSSAMEQHLASLTPLWHEPLAVAGIPYGYIGSPGDGSPSLFRLGDQVAVIPSFAGDGIAIALHTALLAAQVHALGGDSTIYQRQACKDLTQPVRNAKLLADLLSYRLGRKAAFMCAELRPKFLRDKLLREMILRTRVGLGSAVR